MNHEYSTAFELLIKNDQDDDLVGFLAYAYYKRDKRDRALKLGRDSDEIKNHHTILTEKLIDQYRESALRQLEAYGKLIVAQVEPEIQEGARQAQLETAKNELIAHIDSRSGWSNAIITNVIAWLISLAITFLVAVSAGKLAITISPS